MSRLRVAMVTAFPEDPERPRGGVEAVSVTLAASLARLPDLQIDVVTGDPRSAQASTSTWEGITVHRLPWRGRQLSAAWGPARRRVREYLLALAPDVVHSHDVYGLMVTGLTLPRVFTIHGFIHADTRVSGRRGAWLRAQIWRRVETRGWADQPHIVSISPYVRERLIGIVPGAIHDIENPIAAAFFETPRREQPGRVLCAGLIEPRKNTLGLVEAFARVAARVPQAQLRLAGAIGDPAYGRKVEERVQALGIAPAVSFLGPLAGSELRQELSAASVFALVSLEENAPLALEEAMAVGVTALASDRCGMPYMVRHGETGFLVDPLRTDDVAARLLQLLQDEKLRAAFGEQARILARARFHPVAVARRTRDVYREAAGRGPLGATTRSTR